jgi:hypothetical protein
MNIGTLSLLIALPLIHGSVPPDPQPTDKPAASPEKKPTAAQLSAVDPASGDKMKPLLLEIAREYKSYVRVSNSANWAPERCMLPPPDGVLTSLSKDDGTHGKKLYFLFARNDKDYAAIGWHIYEKDAETKPFAAAVGQVIVKESFKPVKITDPRDIPPPPKPNPSDPSRGLNEARDLPDEYTRDKDGNLFRTGDPAGLFIMAKLAKTEKPGTDAGWIYATISPDLKEVTAFGRIDSCMECHTKTTRDRLFGPKWLQERDAHKSSQQPAVTPMR